MRLNGPMKVKGRFEVYLTVDVIMPTSLRVVRAELICSPRLLKEVEVQDLHGMIEAELANPRRKSPEFRIRFVAPPSPAGETAAPPSGGEVSDAAGV